jgi:catechol 2,3-dioxygenase-like lactoylglutathione lyase family enzyme
MATLDHVIIKVNDLKTSVDFYGSVLGFDVEGSAGPFAVVRLSPACQIQLAPWGTAGTEHYAFTVSALEFERICNHLKSAGIAFGPTFDSVGSNGGPGEESGAQGFAPTLYFNDPNNHLLEIRTHGIRRSVVNAA